MPIEGRIQVPGNSIPVGNQEITLNGDQYSTLTKIDGSFTFYDVPTGKLQNLYIVPHHSLTSLIHILFIGVYLLDVSDIRATYPQMKIKLSAENGTVTVVEYKYLGAKRVPAAYPIVITAIMPNKYFQTRPPISVIGLITGNPMIIMMLFALVMIVAFPNMLAGLSPEDLQELKKSQGSGDPMKELSKLMGVGGAEAKDEDDD